MRMRCEHKYKDPIKIAGSHDLLSPVEDAS